jgi:zinc and cadmium transporter
MSWWFYILLIAFPLTGGIIGYYANLSKKLNIKVLLAFAGAYLLSVVLFHLIPHIYVEANVLSGVLLLAGFFFQVFLEKFSRGVEHGHLHLHQHGKPNKLIPYEILISLSLHSFMEGMPLGSGLLENSKSELSFLFGIVSHEMPAAFAMVSILKASHVKPKLLQWFIVIYASMSATGAGISALLKNSVDPHLFEYLMAFVVGTFLHIATTILFENSEEHRFSRNKVLAIIGGVCLAALVSL